MKCEGVIHFVWFSPSCFFTCLFSPSSDILHSDAWLFGDNWYHNFQNLKHKVFSFLWYCQESGCIFWEKAIREVHRSVFSLNHLGREHGARGGKLGACTKSWRYDDPVHSTYSNCQKCPHLDNYMIILLIGHINHFDFFLESSKEF